MIVRILILIAVLSGLAGCTTTQTSSGAFCQNSSPIRLSKQAIKGLSDAEVQELLIRNALGAEMCGWKP
jgi:hypothetical protein